MSIDNCIESGDVILDEMLSHSGVKGMKWGVRKKRTPSIQNGSRVRKGKKQVVSTHKNKPKGTNIKELSDAELRAKITRLQLEREFAREMNKSNPEHQTSKGKRIMKSILNDMVAPAAKDLGTQLIKSQGARIINDTFKLQGDYKVVPNNRRK